MFRVDFFRTNGPALWTRDSVCVTDSWRVAYAWLVHVISIWFTYVWFKTAQFPCMFFCMFCNVVYVNYLYCRWFCVCVCFLNILNLCQCAYAISVRAADFELLHSWFVCTKCLLHLTPLGCLEISIISLKINWGLPNPQRAMHLISQPQTVSSVRSAPSPSPQVVYKMLQLGSNRIKIKENTWNLHFINCVLCAVHLAHRPKLFIKCFNQVPAALKSRKTLETCIL